MDPIMELKRNMDELTEMFSSKMTAFEESISTPKTDLNTLANEFNTFKSLIWKTVSNLKCQMDLVIKCLDSYEMKSRSNILLLHGEPEKPNENLSDCAVKICHDKLSISNITTQSFDSCIRLGRNFNVNKPRPILLRFANLQSRIEVWSNKSKLKNSGLTISEFLTSHRHSVFIEARKIFGIKSCWTRDGKIIITCPDGSRHRITSMDELRLLHNNNPKTLPVPSTASNRASKEIEKNTPNSKMDNDTIIETIKDSIKIVRLNKPRRKNAIDYDMYVRITKIINNAATDNNISMIVLTGTGDFYSSGNDLVSAKDSPDDMLVILEEFIKAFITFPKLLVAVVNGPAVGVTVTTLPLCDFVFASDNAYFYTPFTKLGIIAEGCSTFTFPRLIGERKAMELLLLNYKMPAQEALECGLISNLYKTEDLQQKAWEKIVEISNIPQHSAVTTKSLIRRMYMDELLKTNAIEMKELGKLKILQNKL